MGMDESVSSWWSENLIGRVEKYRTLECGKRQENSEFKIKKRIFPHLPSPISRKNHKKFSFSVCNRNLFEITIYQNKGHPSKRR